MPHKILVIDDDKINIALVKFQTVIFPVSLFGNINTLMVKINANNFIGAHCREALAVISDPAAGIQNSFIFYFCLMEIIIEHFFDLTL